MTAAQYTFPSAVGCLVMSVSHSRSSFATAKLAVHQVFLGRGIDQVLPARAAVDGPRGQAQRAWQDGLSAFGATAQTNWPSAPTVRLGA